LKKRLSISFRCDFVMMLVLFKNILFCSIFLVAFSCKKDFKPASEAYFITTNKVQLITKLNQGYGSHNITDLWLYTNGFFRGAYPIGSKMPIMLADGKASIQLLAGIKNNGISETRINWLLFEPIKLDTIVKSGENITRNFSFNYKDAVVFKWLESFELSGFSLVKSAISDTIFKVHTNDEHVFEGNKSIELGLTGNALLAQLESAVAFDLPTGAASGNVYLELDYKGNTQFEVHVSTNNDLAYVSTVNPKENWNKIYIQLSDAININTASTFKKIVIKVFRNQSITEQKIYLDNIKLVYL